MIALVIIGLIVAVISPNLGKGAPEKRRNTFIARLNGLVQFAWQNALITHTPHRIFFDFDKKKIIVESEQNKENNKIEYEPVAQSYISTSLTIPENLEIVNLFIGGSGDEMRKSDQIHTIWFFIMPDGLTQEVTINLVDYNDLQAEGNPWKVGLVLNPFSAQFKVYDTFAK